MKIVSLSLIILTCIGLSSVLAAEPQSSKSKDLWVDIADVVLESHTDRQARCAKEIKKAQRKAFWASFWLGFASGLGNSSVSQREADVVFTDKDGNKSRGTIKYTDPYRLEYLNERDRQYNYRASSQVAATHMQKTGCWPY